MTPHELLRGIERVNFHRRGIKCLQLFKVEAQFLAALREEILQLVAPATERAIAGGHRIENWVNHYGTTLQVKLSGALGLLGQRTLPGFRPADPARFPATKRFLEAFPGGFNFKVNGFGPDSGVPLHEEHVVLWNEEARRHYVVVRFHLPLVTNPECKMLLDGEIFKFEEGNVYFFNRGAIHGARNRGPAFRYHLLWDALLSEQTYLGMFDRNGAAPQFLEHLSEQHLPAVGRFFTEEYLVSGSGKKLHTRWHLERWGIAPHTFQNAYNGIVGLWPRRLVMAQPNWPTKPERAE